MLVFVNLIIFFTKKQSSTCQHSYTYTYLTYPNQIFAVNTKNRKKITFTVFHILLVYYSEVLFCSFYDFLVFYILPTRNKYSQQSPNPSFVGLFIRISLFSSFSYAQIEIRIYTKRKYFKLKNKKQNPQSSSALAGSFLRLIKYNNSPSLKVCLFGLFLMETLSERVQT